MFQLNQSDRLSSALKHYAGWLNSFPEDSQTSVMWLKCCPPKRKAVIADHTLSYHEEMPDTQDIMLPNITHQSRSTLDFFFFSVTTMQHRETIYKTYILPR